MVVHRFKKIRVVLFEKPISTTQIFYAQGYGEKVIRPVIC